MAVSVVCSWRCSTRAGGTWGQRTCLGRCLSPLASGAWAGPRPRLQSLLAVWGSLQRWEQCCHSVFSCWVRTPVLLIWQVPEVTLAKQAQRIFYFPRYVSFFHYWAFFTVFPLSIHSLIGSDCKDRDLEWLLTGFGFNALEKPSWMSRSKAGQNGLGFSADMHVMGSCYSSEEGIFEN